MRALIPTLALLLSIPLAHGHLAAATVEVQITNGDVIVGEVGEETATTLELKRLVMIRHKATATSVTVPKNIITKRSVVPSLTAQYDTRRAKADSSLFDQCALARWCFDHALVSQAIAHTKQAESDDSFSPIVAKLYNDLGFTKVGDAWVNEDEHLTNTGMVKVGNKVMTKDEAAAAKESLAKNNANARLEQQVQDAESIIKTSEKKITDATQKRDNAKSELAKAQADVQGAQNRGKQVEKQIEAAAAASGKNQNNRQQQKQTTDNQATLQEAANDFAKANSAKLKWEKDLANHDEALAKLKTSLEKAKAALPELKKQLEAATGKPSEPPAATPKPTDEKPASTKPKSRFGE
jgi:hypothetical protein